jgi:hypothetical protein
VVASSGSVVAVPLVGRVPLHPPDAVQVCALVALHCNVTGVPITTALFMAARVTAGFAVVVLVLSPPTKGDEAISLLADCPHAANAENAAHPIAQRNRHDALAESSARR